MAELAKVLTVSTSVAAGRAADRGGAVAEATLLVAGFEVVDRSVVTDGVEAVRDALLRLSDDFNGVIVTTGGTGFSPSDTTPEATRLVIERDAPGFSEAMRRSSPLGRMSRAVAGCRGQALILNTPGSPSGAKEFLDAVLDAVPHALSLLRGESPHPHAESGASEHHDDQREHHH